MRDPNHILLDDRTIIKRLGDIVAGGTDQLDAALECLVIRPRPYKSGQEGMVDIDDALRVTVYEVVRQDLHVPRQHHKIRLVLSDQRVNARFRLLLVVLRDGYDD